MKWLSLSLLFALAAYPDSSGIKNGITGQKAFVSYKDESP